MQALRANWEPLTVHSEQQGQAVHLHVSGELDMATSPLLERWLLRADREGNSEIVVDLENVTFMDGSSLRTILSAADRARRNGRTFAIVNAPAMVRRVLQITGTTYLLGTRTPSLARETSALAQGEPS